MSEEKVEYEGRTLSARVVTAGEWFSCVDLEGTTQQDFALVACSIVDDKGEKVFEPEDVSEVPITVYAKLYGLVMRTNKPAEPEKK